MACLTPEQLAALVLVPDGTESSPHVDECPTCLAQLVELRGLTQELAAAHARLDRNHAASRAQLLARLSCVDRRARTATTWKRFAFGGLGLSSAVAALLLVAFFATSFNQLSAMERMVKAIREVTSYSFQQLNTTTYLDPGGKPRTVRHETGFTCWRAPSDADREWLGDLYADVKSWRVSPAMAGDTDEPPTEKLQLNVVEIYPTGKPGILIVYSEGFYFWTPPVRAGEILNVSPMAKLRAVREGAGRIVRELGTRKIDGREARGYVMDFQGAVPFLDMGPVDVWLDPKTDLPMEVSYEWTKEKDEYVDVYRMTDIRWNIDFPPNQFATVPPADLVNTTPPSNQEDVEQIVTALRHYAELSGGHYPRVRTTYPATKRDPEKKSDPPNLFDGQLVRNEMLKLAGFTGPQQAEWSQNPKFQQIESATPGLDWLTRIFLSHHRAGFFGDEVGPQDKDKVLLWWAAGTDAAQGGKDRYRVFYGDLRTEIVPRKKWLRLMPPEFAELTE